MPECARYLHSLEGFSGKWELRHHAKSDLFCGGACRAAYQLKRSSTRLRRKLHMAERGVCRSCGVDCDHVWLRLRLAAHPEERWNVLVEEMSLSMEHAKKCLVGGCTGTIKKLCNEPTEGALWQCDHIHEVRHGGGEASDLSQVQTLCVFCHLVKTHNPTAFFDRDVQTSGSSDVSRDFSAAMVSLNCRSSATRKRSLHHALQEVNSNS